MSLPFFPKRDDLFSTLRKRYVANLIEMPQPCVQTLSVVERDPKHQVDPMLCGLLSSFLDNEAVGQVQDVPIPIQRLTDLEGVLSAPVPLKLARKMLDGLIRSFINHSDPGTPSFKPALRSLTSIAFSFEKVFCYQIPHKMLFRALRGAKLNPDNPAGSMFVGNKGSEMLVIDCLLMSNGFSIHFNTNGNPDLSREVASLKKAVRGLDKEVEILWPEPNVLHFRSPLMRPFAVSCIQLKFDTRGFLMDIPLAKKRDTEEFEFKKALISCSGDPVSIEESAFSYD